MAKDLINSIADMEAIRGQVTSITNMLNGLTANIEGLANNITKIYASMKSETSTSGLSKQMSDAGKQIDELEKKEKEYSTATKQLVEDNKRLSVSIKDVMKAVDDQNGTFKQNLATQASYKKQIAELSNEQKELTKSFQQGKISNSEYSKQLLEIKVREEELKTGLASTNQMIKMQAKEMSQAKTSIAGMELQLANMKKAYKQMSDQARATPVGLALEQNIKSLDAAVKKSNASIGDFQKNVGNYKSGIDGVAKVLGAFGLAVGGVSIAKKAFNATISATNDLADKYKLVMAEAKAGTDFFFRAVASGDWSNFFSGIRDAVEAARDYTNAMDEIEDRLRSVSVQEAKLKKEIAEQRNIMVDQTKSTTDRLDAASKIQEKEEKILTLREKELEDISKLEVKTAAKTHKINEETLRDFVTNYNNREKEIALARRLIKAEDDLAAAKKGRTIDMGELGTRLEFDQGQIAAAQEDVNRAMAEGGAGIKEFANEFRKYGKVTDEIRDKIAKAEIAVLNAQEQYASSIRRITSTRSRLEEEIRKENQEKIDKANKEAADKANAFSELSIKAISDEEERKIKEREYAFEKEKTSLQKNFKDVNSMTAEEKQSLLNLEIVFDRDVSAIINDAYEKRKQEREKAAKEAADKDKKDMEERIQTYKEDFAKEREVQVEAQIKEEELTLGKYKSGLLNREQYEQQLSDIRFKYQKQEVEDTIKHLEGLLKLEGVVLGPEKRLEVEKQLLDAKKALNDAETKDVVSNLEKQNKAREKAVEHARELAKKGFDMVLDFLSSESEAKIQQYDDEIARVDEQRDRELERLDESVMSEQTRADETKRINEEAETERKKLEQAKRKERIKQAAFEKAAAIMQIGIDTASAVMKVTAQTGVFAAALIPAIIALGVAQAAIVSSKPIPQYADGIFGNESHGGGLAVVGDGGKTEYMLTQRGEIYATPSSPTLVDMARGTQVFPDYDSLMTFMQPEIPRYQSTSTAYDFNRLENSLVSAIKQNKPVQHVSMNLDSQGIWYISRNGSRTSKYVNSKLKGN